MICKINRKVISILLLIVFCLSLSSCGSDDDKEASSSDKPCEILLVTDYGTVNDGAFNQGCWQGVSDYAEEKGIAIDNYQPSSTDKDAILEQFKRGIKNGAKIIVCPGYLLEEAVFDAQKKYSDTTFILIDGQPHNEDYSDMSIGDNVKAIAFSEEEAGFLAGYAAVRDGYKGLGFMGGVAEEPVIRYGYGFVQGADYAAIEMGVEVHIRYAYMNTFSDEPIVETTAATWFDDDTEVIFACGGTLGKGVMKVAENHNGKVIGVDVDQAVESETVITSATKSLSNAVYNVLDDYYNGRFVGGVCDTYTAKENGVMLPMSTSRFEKFSQEDYDSIYQRIVDGMIKPYDGTDIGTTQELSLVNTTVTYIVLE